MRLGYCDSCSFVFPTVLKFTCLIFWDIPFANVGKQFLALWVCYLPRVQAAEPCGLRSLFYLSYKYVVCQQKWKLHNVRLLLLNSFQ